MAAVSKLEVVEELPEETNNAAAVLALSPAAVPWRAAVAERYERLEKLGQGMFGDVYKAWDRELKRFVAVKRLSGRTDDRFVATPPCDFEREVMSLMACGGDGEGEGEGHRSSVVQIMAEYGGRGADGGDSFIVTEYAGPMNLREYMHVRRLNGQPFGEGEVRDVVEQLLAGAKRVHMAGVLHRDIVPENVVVDMDAASCRMVYKICGFGMAVPPGAQAGKDDSGMLASSSPYRAPELFVGSMDYDGRVDTWSIGCIMAELVTGDGVPFFGGGLDGDVFTEILHVVGTKCNLKKKFPPKVLSRSGFKVLKGLLHINPDRRLSAAAALRKPWFRRRHCLFSASCFVAHGGVAP